MTSFNGSAITYDALGNPLIYYNGTSFTWQGRRLVGAVKGANTMSFTYDDNGLRTSKTVNGITTEYYWNGNLLVAEKTPDYLIIYNYDASGRPIGMAYHGSDYTQYQWDVYWFDLNLYGDVIAVYNNDKKKLVNYTYDPWGYCDVEYYNKGATTSAVYNSLRYRGYYYDTDLGLYYLQSRYYDANTYRFVNADGYISTGQGILGYNMFAYCGNNPVNKVDYVGNKPGDLFDTMDEAALDFAICYNELSIADKQEYGSAIYTVKIKIVTYQKTPWYLSIFGIKYRRKITEVVKYSYTEPSIGKNGDSVMPNIWTSKRIVSTVHTHANYSSMYDNENFSKGFMSDIGWSNFFRMDSYVVTPGGYLKKYTYANRKDSNGGVTIIADDIPWDPNSPDHK